MIQTRYLLFKGRKVCVDCYAAHIVDEREVLSDVRCGPVTEVAIEYSLISTCRADKSTISNYPSHIVPGFILNDDLMKSQ